MPMTEEQGTGHSLGLMPEPAERARLEALIARLAARLGTPPFPPHVTRLGSLPGSPDALLEATRALGRESPPLAPRLTRSGGQDAFFRCFYAEVEAAAALEAFHARAVARLGARTPASFFPHVSLVYGALSSEQKALLADALRPEVEARTVAFTALRLVRTEGRVTDWRTVGEVALTG
jgi:2'-5' RNA ligase